MSEEIKIAQAKTVSYCGIGAICRAGDECFVICDTSRWTDRDGHPTGTLIPIVRQHLKRRLVDMGFNQNIQLRTPPVLKSLPDGKEIGARIPAMRFPSWMVCMQCHRLHFLPWINIPCGDGGHYKSVSEIKCNNNRNEQRCNGRLEYVQYVLVHESGYLDDIPWKYLSHKGATRLEKCENRDYLYLRRNESGRLELRCGHCNHIEDIAGIMTPHFWEWHKRMKKQPWRTELVSIPEGTTVRPYSITDVNVHIPRTVTALDIPPESDVDDSGLHARLQQDDRYELLIKWRRDGQVRLLNREIKKLATRYRCDQQKLLEAFDDLQRGWPYIGQEHLFEAVDEEEMKKQEFLALCKKRTYEPHARFSTINVTEEWKNTTSKYSDILDELVLVNKLKEVRVFGGFSRHKPNGQRVNPHIDDTDTCTWLPACELYGEGVFFSLNEKKLQKWEQCDSVKERAEVVEKRRNQAQSNRLPKATSRFILLHSVSHLLIQELVFVCGYPAASMKERIFCSPNINGILVYIAVPNKLGSLGGLIDQCKPPMFHKLLSRAFERAHQCSYDPICGEHEGQGMNELNRAACHGCLLVPEITCENNNCLLDRKFIIGDAKTNMPGFITHALGD